MSNKTLKIQTIIWLFFICISTVNADFIRDEDKEIVTDTSTHLQWQDDKNATNGYIWEDAVKYCENLTLGGYDDWRLPNIIELLSIVDDSRINPTINTTFKNTANKNYWTSTTRDSDTKVAWCVEFSDGQSYYSFKTDKTIVRCVRDDN